MRTAARTRAGASIRAFTLSVGLAAMLGDVAAGRPAGQDGPSRSWREPRPS